MDSNALAKKIASEIIDSFTSALKSLNPFTFLQVIFMVELHFLMINSVIRIVMSEMMQEGIIPSTEIPSNVINFNDRVFQIFNEYAPFILVLSVCMLLCGLSLFVLRFIPIISNYRLVRQYCDYGLYASVWLFLIWISYYYYLKLQAFYVFFYIGIFLVGALFIKVMRMLAFKLGFS